tara:strand:+ start:1307 stop:2170 length:864 start_codon:yes stop_codon:yes gene_type:complete
MTNTKELKIGIVGHGFVGKATDWGFNKHTNKFIVDPKIGTNIDQLSEFNPELIFVCVPTPMGENGVQDSSIIEAVVKELSTKFLESIIVIKSTVLPSILQKLEKANKKIIYNPEFLREKHANNDFMNSEMIIFGGNKDIASKVSRFYLNHSRCKSTQHIFMDISSASLVKYSINTFLAAKVLFFNELNDVFNKLESNDDWKKFIDTLSLDKRIGESHMNVPGHDGKKGFGGACFPKDTAALLKYAEDLGLELDILKSVINKNNMIRSQYTELDDREKEQNISFDDKI